MASIRTQNTLGNKTVTDNLSIAMAQINQRVGNLKGNADAMLSFGAKAGDVDLVLSPEQQLIGYTAEDLVLKPAFHRLARELGRLAAATADGGPAMLVGSILKEADGLYNIVALLSGGSGSLRSAGSTNCPIMAPLTKSGYLHPAPCPIRWNFAVCNWGCRFARMAGCPACAAIWRPRVRSCWFRSMAAPMKSTRMTGGWRRSLPRASPKPGCR